MANMNLDFYDVKSKKKFKSSNWKKHKRGNRYYAVAKSPSTGIMCWRAIGAKVLGKK